MKRAPKLWTRRVVLQRAMQLSGLGVATPLAINLAAIGEAAAFESSGYKALVCVFMYGGNDYANTVVPYDVTNYALYHQIRAGAAGENEDGIALARADLAATALTPLDGAVLTDGLQYALAPQLSGLKSLFDAGRLAIQLNVGPLIQPTTLAQYRSSNKVANPLPPKLFSHNDQQSVWQSDGSEGSTNGWGGRLGDIALSSNPSNAQLTCISASSNAVFVSGRDAMQYQISGNGAIRINALSGTLRNAVNAIVTRSSAHVLEDECAAVTRRSIELEGTVNTALGGVTLTTAFPNNPLARQMRVVARLIAANATLGVKRQVFFVSLGGFDNHNSLMTAHPATHDAARWRHERVLRGHRRARRGRQGHDLHRLGFRTHLVVELRWLGSRLGLASFRDGRRRERRAVLRNRAACVHGDRRPGRAGAVAADAPPSTSSEQRSRSGSGAAASELPGILPNIGNFSNTSLGFL